MKLSGAMTSLLVRLARARLKGFVLLSRVHAQTYGALEGRGLVAANELTAKGWTEVAPHLPADLSETASLLGTGEFKLGQSPMTGRISS